MSGPIRLYEDSFGLGCGWGLGSFFLLPRSLGACLFVFLFCSGLDLRGNQGFSVYEGGYVLGFEGLGVGAR